MGINELVKTCLGTVKRIPLLLSQLSVRSQNIYIFGAWYGEKFSDNSRAMYLYALEHSGKKCFWICKNKQLYTRLKQAGLPVLRVYSPKGIYYQLRAGVAFSTTGIVDFCRELMGGCTHVELWHGIGGKKVGFDDKFFCETALSPRCRFYAWLEKRALGKRYFIAPSPEMKRIFQSAFRIKDDHFIYAGQPRNDMFYDKDYPMQTISREEFGGKKILLYMPTHRKEGAQQMDIAQLLDLAALDSFCKTHNAVFLIKKHFYHGAEKEHLEAYPNIIDITNRSVDANELLMIADCLISDYSSCVTDYLLLDRPVFYYCFDYQEYVAQDRELYWPFDMITPGPRVEKFPELLEELEQTLVRGQDAYSAERKRVRDMFYAPENQAPAAQKILASVQQMTGR